MFNVYKSKQNITVPGCMREDEEKIFKPRWNGNVWWKKT